MNIIITNAQILYPEDDEVIFWKYQDIGIWLFNSLNDVIL
jgi:hypothetical protein